MVVRLLLTMREFSVIASRLSAFIAGGVTLIMCSYLIFQSTENLVPALFVIIFFGLPPLIFGGHGVITWSLKPSREAKLYATGRRIETQLQQVAIDNEFGDDTNPYRIITQYRDLLTNRVYVFVSDKVWFDPTPFLSGRSVAVFVNPSNFNSYVMDISFLPSEPE